MSEGLYIPKVQLTKEELIFFALCDQALPSPPKGLNRDQSVALVNRIGEEKGYPQSMRDRVIAYLDELFFAPTRGLQ